MINQANLLLRGFIAAFALSLCFLFVACGDDDEDDPDLCSNTCEFANDDECDDGGPNSDFDICDLGTDCADCGTR